MNGKSKEFVADESDMHVSDEDLKNFYDNVNSAACVSIDTTPGNKVNLWQNDLFMNIVYYLAYCL